MAQADPKPTVTSTKAAQVTVQRETDVRWTGAVLGIAAATDYAAAIRALLTATLDMFDVALVEYRASRSSDQVGLRADDARIDGHGRLGEPIHLSLWGNDGDLGVDQVESDGDLSAGVHFYDRDLPTSMHVDRLTLRVGDQDFGRLDVHWRSIPAEGDREELESLTQMFALTVARVEQIAQLRARSDAAETARERAAFLAEAGTRLAIVSDEGDVIEQLARLLVPVFADACVFDLVRVDDAAGEREGERAAPSGTTPHMPMSLRPMMLDRVLVYATDPERGAVAESFKQFPVDLQASANLVARVIRSGQSNLEPTVTDAMLAMTARNPQHLAMLRQLDIRSHLVVPLTARGNRLGAVTLLRVGERDPFDVSDLAGVEALAVRASLSLDNVRSYRRQQNARQAAERFADRTARLQMVTSAFSEAVTMTEIGQEIVDHAVAAIGARGGVVVIHESSFPLDVPDQPTDPVQVLDGPHPEENAWLRIVATAGYDPSEVAPWRRIGMDVDMPVVVAARTGEFVFSSSAGDWLGRFPNAPVTANQAWRALLAVPLIAEGAVIGALGFTLDERDNLEDEDRAFVTALANQCALALERTRLFTMERTARLAAERSRQRAAFLADAGAIIASSLAVEDTLRMLPELLVPGLADWCLIHLCDVQADRTLPDQRSVPAAARTCHPRPIASLHADPQRAADRELLSAWHTASSPVVGPGKAMAEGRALHLVRPSIADLHGDRQPTGDEAAIEALGIRSAISVPFNVQGTCAGTLTVLTAESDRELSSDDAEMVAALAERIALAVDRATMYETLEGELAERTRAEAALRASEETNRALLAAIPDLMFRISAEGTISDYRAAQFDLLYAPTQFIGRSLSDLMPPSVADVSYQAISDALRSGEVQTFEYELDGPAGVGDFEARIAICGPDQVLAIVRDVTARKRAERTVRFLAEVSTALTASLDLQATFATIARMAVPFLGDWCVVDEQLPGGGYRRAAVSAADPAHAELALTFKGFPPESDSSVGPGSVLRSAHPEYFAEIPADFITTMTQSSELRLLMSEIGVQSYLSVPLIARGRVLGSLSCFMTGSGRTYQLADLSVAEDLARRAALAVDSARLFEEQVVARERLQQLAAERTRVLGQIADGVLIVDPDERIVFINEAAHRLHGGVEIAVTIGDYVRVFQPHTPDGRTISSEELPVVRAIRNGDTSQNSELRLRRPDGGEVAVLCSAAPVVNDDGRLLGAVLTLHDISAQREFERHKDDFIASISHDLKTPLTSIKGWAQLLLQRAELDEQRVGDRKALGAIAEQSRTMQRLIEQLLDASRLQLERAIELRRRQFDVVPAVERMIELHQGLTQQHTFRVTGIEPGVAIGFWDADVLSQIVGNLLANATKYSPDGGEITVDISVAGGAARIAVIDRGIGVPETALTQIFGQFYRASNAVNRNDGKSFEGLGLGLFSARQLAERMSGYLEVTSREGQGSTFTLVLPLIPPELG